jgi:formylglycine-generating enzyme required for sulfatase activity
MYTFITGRLIRIAIATCLLVGIATQVWAAENAPSDPESVLWFATQKKNTTDGYEVYLAQYADGKYATFATSAIHKIKTDKAIQEENAEWKIVQDSEDETTVLKFQDKYPKGVNAIAVKLRLATIRKIATELKPSQTFKGCATCPEMVIVPSGSFVMGDANNAHNVKIAAPFAIGKKEVTQKEWIAVMGSNPSKFNDCAGNCPVDNISWNEAQEFIRMLNLKTGKKYRLPSEAEWEYSCRAGLEQKFCGSDDANAVAWYGTYSIPEKLLTRSSKQVATKKANAWGLFDMSGNVSEWTQDGYHENFNGAPTDGSAWPGDGQGYVLRGGSWGGTIEQIRATYRDYDGPSNKDISYGFRIARNFP